MDHAGLEISDDAIRCIQFVRTMHGMKVKKYGSIDIPPGIIEGGDVKDEVEFKKLLTAFDQKYDLSYVKVSIPEEKAYMFQVDVPSADPHIATQNIEFKLEENVPLTAADAVFYFDLIPTSVTGGALRASVVVVPRSYVEKYIGILRETGIFPVAFEVVPTAVARSIATGASVTELVVHSMKHKTGIYIISGGVVTFTSTIEQGSSLGDSYADILSKEILRINTYWLSRAGIHPNIQKVVLLGDSVSSYRATLTTAVIGTIPVVEVANVWAHNIDTRTYTSPISQEESLQYGVSAGLAIDS
jgi:hypothetical protein